MSAWKEIRFDGDVWWERVIGAFRMIVEPAGRLRIKHDHLTLYDEEVRSDNLDGLKYLIEKEAEAMLRSALDELRPPAVDESEEARQRRDAYRIVQADFARLDLDVQVGASPEGLLAEGRHVWSGYGGLEEAVDALERTLTKAANDEGSVV